MKAGLLAGRQTAGGFDPNSITGLEAWFDADDASTITHSSNEVSQWDDKTGNGHDLTVAAGKSSPTTNTRTQNSKNVLDFDGVADQLSTTNFWYGLGDSTVFVVFIADASAGEATLSGVVFDYSGASGDEFGFRAYGTTPRLEFLLYDQSGAVKFQLVSSTSPYTTWNLATATFNPGTSANLRMNGVSEASAGAHTTTGLTFGGFYIGNYPNPGGNRGLNGAVAEALVYDSVLGSTDRDAVETYLTDKWGL